MVSVAYLDTSALVKRYITEVGSGWVGTLLRDPTTRTFTSLLTIITRDALGDGPHEKSAHTLENTLADK